MRLQIKAEAVQMSHEVSGANKHVSEKLLKVYEDIQGVAICTATSTRPCRAACKAEPAPQPYRIEYHFQRRYSGWSDLADDADANFPVSQRSGLRVPATMDQGNHTAA